MFFSAMKTTFKEIMNMLLVMITIVIDFHNVLQIPLITKLQSEQSSEVVLKLMHLPFQIDISVKLTTKMEQSI